MYVRCTKKQKSLKGCVFEPRLKWRAQYARIPSVENRDGCQLRLRLRGDGTAAI